MNKKLFFLSFFKINIFTKAEIIDDSIEIPSLKKSNVIFFCLAKKGLLPKVNYTKSYKYCDFFVGSSNGFELYFINKSKFRFGLLSLRHESLVTLFEYIVSKIDKNIGFFFTSDLLYFFLTSFFISAINIKFGPISINFIEYNFLRCLFPLTSSRPSITDDYKTFMKENVLYQNDYIVKNISFFLELFFPNVKIDISQLIYNIKNKKSFFNTSF